MVVKYWELLLLYSMILKGIIPLKAQNCTREMDTITYLSPAVGSCHGWQTVLWVKKHLWSREDKIMVLEQGHHKNQWTTSRWLGDWVQDGKIGL